MWHWIFVKVNPARVYVGWYLGMMFGGGVGGVGGVVGVGVVGVVGVVGGVGKRKEAGIRHTPYVAPFWTMLI